MSTAHANVPPISIPASADLSAYQFRAMKLGSTGLALPSAGGDVVGILQDAPSAAGIAFLLVGAGEQDWLRLGAAALKGAGLGGGSDEEAFNSWWTVPSPRATS